MSILDTDKDFRILVKAGELADYTIKITDNAKRFPKKYRFTFVNRMQNISLDIYELINTANELNTNDKIALSQRIRLQNQAITKCKTLLFLINLCYKNEKIALNEKQAIAWAKYVVNVKNMTIKWHNQDRMKRK